MSDKVTIEEVVSAMKQAKIRPEEKIDEVMKAIQATLDAAKADKEVAEKKKTKTLILASWAGDGQAITETPVWIFKVPEEFPHVKLAETVVLAIQDFKASGKKKANKVGTVGEGILHVPASYFKARELTRVTKEPVLIQTTNNIVPALPGQN